MFTVNTATIARQKKYIRRKDKFTNETQFVFGVYNVMLYEDVRIFLESDSACDVVVETSSPLWKYGYRFISVRLEIESSIKSILLRLLFKTFTTSS